MGQLSLLRGTLFSFSATVRRGDPMNSVISLNNDFFTSCNLLIISLNNYINSLIIFLNNYFIFHVLVLS